MEKLRPGQRGPVEPRPAWPRPWQEREPIVTLANLIDAPSCPARRTTRSSASRYAISSPPRCAGSAWPCSARFARAPLRVLVHPRLAPSAIKFNRQTDGRFVKIRPTVGLSATGPWWRYTREKPMVYEMERLDRPRSQVHTAVDPATGAEPACGTSTTAHCPAIWPMIQEPAWTHRGTDDGPRTLASTRDTTGLAWTLHDQWPWGGQ